MTGYEPEPFRGTAIAAGCDDFLLKPIDLDRLDAILDYFALTPSYDELHSTCPRRCTFALLLAQAGTIV